MRGYVPVISTKLQCYTVILPWGVGCMSVWERIKILGTLRAHSRTHTRQAVVTVGSFNDHIFLLRKYIEILMKQAVNCDNRFPCYPSDNM